MLLCSISVPEHGTQRPVARVLYRRMLALCGRQDDGAATRAAENEKKGGKAIVKIRIEMWMEFDCKTWVKLHSLCGTTQAVL